MYFNPKQRKTPLSTVGCIHFANGLVHRNFQAHVLELDLTSLTNTPVIREIEKDPQRREEDVQGMKIKSS